MSWGRRPTSKDSANWHAIADRLDLISGVATDGGPEERVEAALALLERGVDRAGDRSVQRHSATGIPTREPLLQQMQRDGSGALAIVRFLDFDRLCAFDPALGDLLLRSVAERLRAMLPPQRLLAHVDRGHLAIWFGAGTTQSLAANEMEAIEYALGQSLLLGEREILPSVHSQIAAVSGEDAETALARALAQLTVSASGLGQPTTPHAAPSLDREDFALEQDLRLAMARGELRLCYQPLIDASKARVCGAEALMRWQHPRRGAVSPSIFVPVMEATGLAHEFGLWALNTAVRESRSWEVSGLGDLRVAVNVSGRQLERDDFSRLVQRTLQRHALPPSALEIELTEGVAMVDCERAGRLFSDVRAMGVSIAIDDFGTGYSSLSTLRKLAFDKIKIDREFVTDVDRRRDSQAICQSIIALARGLGIRVLAEGVERPEEFSWLRSHGCTFFQGYYFSPPLEASTFAAFVEDTQGLRAKLATDARALQQNISKRLSA